MPWLVSIILTFYKLSLVSLYLFFHHICLWHTDHREHGNRIVHEKLTGSRLFPGMPLDPREQE